MKKMKFTALIKDYMKKEIVYVDEDATLTEVVNQMKIKQTGVVIVKFDGKITGVITSSDIFSALVQSVFSETIDNVLITKENVSDIRAGTMLGGPTTVEYMTSCELGGTNPCIQIYEDDVIENAIRVMEISHIHHLLVMGYEGKIVGTISSNDVLRAF